MSPPQTDLPGPSRPPPPTPNPGLHVGGQPYSPKAGPSSWKTGSSRKETMSFNDFFPERIKISVRDNRELSLCPRCLLRRSRATPPFTKGSSFCSLVLLGDEVLTQEFIRWRTFCPLKLPPPECLHFSHIPVTGKGWDRVLSTRLNMAPRLGPLLHPKQQVSGQTSISIPLQHVRWRRGWGRGGRAPHLQQAW